MASKCPFQPKPFYGSVSSPSWLVVSPLCLRSVSVYRMHLPRHGAVSGQLGLPACWPSRCPHTGSTGCVPTCPPMDVHLERAVHLQPLGCNDRRRMKTGRGAVKAFLDIFCPCVLLLCCPPQFLACFASCRISSNHRIIRVGKDLWDRQVQPSTQHHHAC